MEKKLEIRARATAARMDVEYLRKIAADCELLTTGMESYGTALVRNETTYGLWLAGKEHGERTDNWAAALDVVEEQARKMLTRPLPSDIVCAAIAAVRMKAAGHVLREAQEIRQGGGS